MLKYLHEFCQENNIKYFVGYGTLLGAVRHKGFIPWDDDIDIIMPRKDYDKLIELFNKQNSAYKLKNIEIDKKYPYNFSKIYNTETTLVENLYSKYNIGIYIDIFPLDGWPKNNFTIKLLYLLEKITKIKTYKISKLHGFKKNVILILLKPLIIFISTKNIFHFINKICYRAEKEEGVIGNIVANVYGNKEKMEKKWFSDSNESEFENIKVNIPVGYDNILRCLYGNYMTPPPMELQISHHNNIAFFNKD